MGFPLQTSAATSEVCRRGACTQPQQVHSSPRAALASLCAQVCQIVIIIIRPRELRLPQVGLRPQQPLRGG